MISKQSDAAAIDSLCEEWMLERNKHPFYVEGMSQDQIQKCWDESSSNYTGADYAKIRSQIIEEMVSKGILTRDSDIIDLGCGPGLYDFPFSEVANRVVCIDGSAGMIERIRSESILRGTSNIDASVVLWEDFDTTERFDVVFSSLCPALNNPESLLRMERYSRKYCAYVSSANPGPGISLEIWNGMGLDCSFKGYDTRYPYEYLQMLGRDPSLKFYCNDISYTHTTEETIELQCRYIGKYREVTPEVRKLISDIVHLHEDGGCVRESKRLTLGLLTWRVP